MPDYRSFSVSLFDHGISVTFINTEDGIVVLTFAFFELKLCRSELFTEALRRWVYLLQPAVLMDGLLPQLLLHFDVTTLEVSLCILLVQGDGCVTIKEGLVEVTNLVPSTSSIIVNGLIKGTIEWIKLKTLRKQICSDLKHVVLEGLTCACFRVFSGSQAFPESHYFGVIRVNLQCLLDMLFTKVTLAIIDEQASSPEQKDWVAHKLFLHVVCLLNDAAQVVWIVQNACLNEHLHVLDRVSTLLN